MLPPPFARLLGAALVVLVALPLVFAGDPKAEAPKPTIIHKLKFVRGGDAGLHCACVTTRSGCDIKLRQPFAPDTVHEWWQTVQVEAGSTVDVATSCWRKRDVPSHGDALCCSPTLNQNGSPIPAELRSLYGATETREPAS